MRPNQHWHLFCLVTTWWTLYFILGLSSNYFQTTATWAIWIFGEMLPAGALSYFGLAALHARAAVRVAYRVLDRVLHDGTAVRLRLPLPRGTPTARLGISRNALVSHAFLCDAVGVATGGGVAGVGGKHANVNHVPIYQH